MARFAKLYRSVMERTDLTPLSKIIDAHLLDSLNDKPHCWWGIRAIASACGCQKNAAQRAVKELETAGLWVLSRSENLRQSNRYEPSETHPSRPRKRDVDVPETGTSPKQVRPRNGYVNSVHVPETGTSTSPKRVLNQTDNRRETREESAPPNLAKQTWDEIHRRQGTATATVTGLPEGGNGQPTRRRFPEGIQQIADRLGAEITDALVTYAADQIARTKLGFQLTRKRMERIEELAEETSPAAVLRAVRQALATGQNWTRLLTAITAVERSKEFKAVDDRRKTAPPAPQMIPLYRGNKS